MKLILSEWILHVGSVWVNAGREDGDKLHLSPHAALKDIQVHPDVAVKEVCNLTSVRLNSTDFCSAVNDSVDWTATCHRSLHYLNDE